MEASHQSVTFEPKPLTMTKQGKKLAGIVVLIFWTVIVITLMVIINSQRQLIATQNKFEELLEINNAEGQPQIDPNQPRADELLGSERILNQDSSGIETGNPNDNTGSVEEMLEGKEIVIP